MNICVIPARAGSRRIPRKNIKEFNGKPIIAYSIEAALKSNCFSQVIVSTDDDEISKVAKKYGAQVPFVRPNELSNDYVGTIPVIKHTIEWMEDNNNYIENVCCLYATAPFIQPQIISKALQQLQESNQAIKDKSVDAGLAIYQTNSKKNTIDTYIQASDNANNSNSSSTQEPNEISSFDASAVNDARSTAQRRAVGISVYEQIQSIKE